MSRKSFLPLIYSLTISLFFSSAVFVHSSFSEEASVEKEKSELIKDIDTLGKGLEVTKGCVAQARTEEDLRKCREEERIRRYYEVLDRLSEMGMPLQERRIKNLGVK